MRVLLAPRWVVAHILVVLIVAGCVSAGFWQLRRLEQRQATNDLIAERMALPPVPFEELLAQLPAGADTDPTAAAVEDLEHRRVTITGRYLPEEQLLLSPRSRNGSPGHDVLSPLRTDAGTVVVVDRGFVPFEQDVPPPPPDGPVSIRARVGLTQERVGLGPRIPPVEEDDDLERVARVDLPRIAEQLPEPLAPVFAELSAPVSPPGGPRPVEPPVLDEANHRSYAVQWFLFALTGTVGYPLLLRKTVQEARSGQDAPVPPRPREPVG